MYTYPSVTINHVTYTAKRWGQFPTIQYVDGSGDSTPVTAGNEVVQVASDLSAIVVRIQPTASTNLQIKTAILNWDATTQSLYPRDLIDVSIAGGHNSDTNSAGSAQALSGASSVPAPVEPSSRNTISRLAADPINPQEGDVWYNTTDHALRYYDGTTVQTVSHA